MANRKDKRAAVRTARATRSISGGTNNRSWVEVVCDTATAEAIAGHLRANYYDHYAMILYFIDIGVLRPQKS